MNYYRNSDKQIHLFFLFLSLDKIFCMVVSNMVVMQFQRVCLR